MSMKVFEVKVYERYAVSFRLAVCKTRKEMLAAINRDGAGIPGYEPPPVNTKGMFHPTPHLLRSDTPGECYSNMFGTMYLNLDDIDDEAIVHECGHAAFTWEFDIRHYTGPFDDDGHDEQEEYCYFLGMAAAKVRKIIRQNFKVARSKI